MPCKTKHKSLPKHNLGGWVKDHKKGIIGGLEAAAGVALTAATFGTAAPIGAGLITSGMGTIAGDISDTNQMKLQKDQQKQLTQEANNQNFMNNLNVSPANIPITRKGGFIRYGGGIKTSHENGGINVDNEGNPISGMGGAVAEVEGNETLHKSANGDDDYVFSAKRVVPGTKSTYAMKSNSINNKYKLYLGGKLNKFDKLASETRDTELSSLRDLSEMTKPNEDMDQELPQGKSGIHIKPENRGKFNALKAKTGKSTEELTHSKNPLTRKRAIFAQNARKWKHGEGGELTPSSESGATQLQAAARMKGYKDYVSGLMRLANHTGDVATKQLLTGLQYDPSGSLEPDQFLAQHIDPKIFTTKYGALRPIYNYPKQKAGGGPIGKYSFNQAKDPTREGYPVLLPNEAEDYQDYLNYNPASITDKFNIPTKPDWRDVTVPEPKRLPVGSTMDNKTNNTVTGSTINKGERQTESYGVPLPYSVSSFKPRLLDVKVSSPLVKGENPNLMKALQKQVSDNALASKDVVDGWKDYTGGVSPVGAIATGAADLGLAALSASGAFDTKYDDIKATKINPRKIDLSSQRIRAARDAANARAAARLNMRDAQGAEKTAGILASEIGVNRNLGDILGQSYETEANTNAQLGSRADEINASNQQQVNQLNSMNRFQNKQKKNAQTLQFLSEAAGTIPGYFTDLQSSEQNALLANMVSDNYGIQSKRKGMFNRPQFRLKVR